MQIIVRKPISKSIYSKFKMIIFVQQFEKINRIFTLMNLKVSLQSFSTFPSISCYPILHLNIFQFRELHSNLQNKQNCIQSLYH